jgi:hypothetical protein
MLGKAIGWPVAAIWVMFSVTVVMIAAILLGMIVISGQ